MLAYNDIFGLTMDDDKTYVWGLTTDLRKAMKQLGFQCFYDASELGASMSYGARIGNRHQSPWHWHGRQVAEVEEIGGTNATEAFNAAKNLFAQSATWIPACVIADSYLLLPRRAATKAIRINGAGQTPCSDLVCLVT